MYTAEHNKDGSLKHSNECRMRFGRKDSECPRCVEILNGASARKGWQADYYKNKKQQEQRRLEAIKKHDCKKSGCGSVCTFGDW